VKVKTLKQLLESIPDDAEVVMRGSDHTYWSAAVTQEKAVNSEVGLCESDGTESEDELIRVVVFW
jgi:hypothetical protein